MSENFNLEIISPNKTLIKEEVKEVVIPAYEGLMTILKDHISIITFLRPGFIDVVLKDKTEKYYVEEGTVEFYKNNLLILSSTVKNKKDISKEKASETLKETRSLIENKEIGDKERYILSYKISTLEEING